MAHIEAKLALFQAVIKHLFVNTPKAGKAHLAPPPEVLNSVAINRHLLTGPALDNRQDFSHRAVFNHLRIHLAATLGHAEHRRFPSGTAPAPAAYPAGPEVAFIQLNRALVKGAGALAFMGDVWSDMMEQTVCRRAADPGDLGDFASLDIEAKQAQNLAEFRLKVS